MCKYVWIIHNTICNYNIYDKNIESRGKKPSTKVAGVVGDVNNTPVTTIIRTAYAIIAVVFFPLY